MFVRNMFILPQSLEEYKRFVPEFTIIAVPSFKGMPAVDNTASETFICLSFEKKLAIIGNTAYAGEIKKSVFTILNYLLPLEGVLSMHCSANVNPDDCERRGPVLRPERHRQDDALRRPDPPPDRRRRAWLERRRRLQLRRRMLRQGDRPFGICRA